MLCLLQCVVMTSLTLLQVSTRLLELMHPAFLQDHTPLRVMADGNCFYRALSRAMYGHEDSHLLLRLLILLEIGEHRQYYDSTSRRYVDLIEDVKVVNSSWQELFLSTSRPGHYAEMLNMYAASAVLGFTLCSYCPPTHHSEYLSAPLTRLIRGRAVMRSGVPVFTIMWTMSELPHEVKAFIPNHFVVVDDTHPRGEVHIDLTKAFPPLTSRPSPPSLVPHVKFGSAGRLSLNQNLNKKKMETTHTHVPSHLVMPPFPCCCYSQYPSYFPSM